MIKKKLVTFNDFLVIEHGDLSDFIKATNSGAEEENFVKTKQDIIKELFNLTSIGRKEPVNEHVNESVKEQPTFKYILKTNDIEDYYTLLPVIRDSVLNSSLHVKDDTFYLKVTLSKKESILEAQQQVICLPLESKFLTENAYDLIK